MTGSPTLRRGRRSFASLGGYSGIARTLGTQLCDCGSWVTATGRQRYRLFNHETGFTAYRMTVIHWRDRPVTRRGLYRFLKLVATTRIAHHRMERGVSLYRQNLEVNALARQLGVRFPREFADHDRARVRLWLGKVRPIDREFPEQRELLRRITAWSRN